MDGVESLKLGTVMLGVREMERSVAFYRDALGLSVQFASAEFSFLSAGGVALVLRAAAGLEPADGHVLSILGRAAVGGSSMKGS